MRILSLIAALSMAASLAASAGAKTAPQYDASDPTGAGMGDYLSARFAANQHDYVEAARLFKASLARDPGNPELLNATFFFAASAGMIDDAAAIAAGVVANEPDSRAARLALAVVAMKHRDYHRARVEIGKSAKGAFTSFTVALIDGWAAAGASDAGAAKANFKLLHAQTSADGLAFFNEAMLAEFFGEKEAADTAYKAALEASGPTPRVVDAYGRFLERSGRAAEARKLYEKMAPENGYSAVTAPGLARIAAGTIPDALAPRAEDGAAEALYGIAASLNDENSREVSILYLRLALYLQPKLDLATIQLAGRFESLGKYDDAIAVYQAVESKSAFYRMASASIAIDLARQDKTGEATARLETLARQYPDDLDIWTALGNSYRVGKRYSDAVTAYDRALKLAGTAGNSIWPLLYARAVAEQETGDWAKAETDLKQALVLSPNEPQLLNYLGYSWVDQQRNIKEALTMLEKARALSPQDGYIIDSVGWAYYHLGRYNEAVDALEDAVQLVPGDSTINDHLGDAYFKAGRTLDAQFQWNHALAFGPEPSDKAKIEKKLLSAGP